MMRAVLVLALVAGACAKKVVGLPCAISYGSDNDDNPDDDGVQCVDSARCTVDCSTGEERPGGQSDCTGDDITVAATVPTVPALECPAGICLAVEGQTEPRGLCSARCEDDSECEGETSECRDPTTLAESGFVCVLPFSVDIPRLNPDEDDPSEHCETRVCVCKPYAIAAGLLCPDKATPTIPEGCDGADEDCDLASGGG